MSVYKSLLLTPGQRQQGAWRGLLNVGQALSAAGAPSTMPTSTMSAFSKGLAAYAPGYDQYANDMRGQKLQDTQYQMQQQQMQQQQMAIDAAKRKKAQEEQQRLAAERWKNQQMMGGAQGPTVGAAQNMNTMDPLQRAMMEANPVGTMQSQYATQTAQSAADLAAQRAMKLEEFKATLDPRRQYVPIEGVGVMDVASGKLLTPGQFQNVMSPEATAQAGFRPGTVARQGPEGIEVLQPGKEITPTSLQEKAYAESIERIDAAQESIQGLEAALKLSDKAYEGPSAQERAYAAKGLPDFLIPDETREGAIATGEMDKIVQGQALSSLKATFGGMPTEGERKILMDIQGSSELPKEERDKLWRRGIELAKKKIARDRKKAAAYEERFGDRYSMGYGKTRTYNPESGEFE